MDEDAVRPAFILSKVANKQSKVEWKSSAPIKTYSKKSSPPSATNGCGGKDSTRPSRHCRPAKPFFFNDFICDIKSNGDESDQFFAKDLDIDLKVVNEADIDDLLLTESATGRDYVIDMELPHLQETQTIPLPLPLREVRAEPEEQVLGPSDEGPAEDNDDEDDGLKLGDLAWASVGGYPYWPCMVSNDPDTENFTKERAMGKGTYTFYHVTYFGDRGRRSWVKESCMKPYNGVNTFKALAEKFSTPEVKKKSLKLYKSYTVMASQRKAWNQAVEEAESQRLVPRKDRLAFFDKFNKPLSRPRARRNSLPFPMGALIPQRAAASSILPEECQDQVSVKGEVNGAIDGSVQCYTVQTEGDEVNLVISMNDKDQETNSGDHSLVPLVPPRKMRRLSLPPNLPARPKNMKRGHVANDKASKDCGPPDVKRCKGLPKKNSVPPLTPSSEVETPEKNNSSTDHPKRYSVRLVTRASIEDAYPPTASPASPRDSISVTPSKTRDEASTSAMTPASLPPPKDEHSLKQVIADNPHLTPAVVKKLLALWKNKNVQGSSSSATSSKKSPRKPPEKASIEKTETPEPPETKSPQKKFVVPSTKPSTPRINKTSVLFSDVKHDKICSICFVPGGELFKCKGPCCLFMHPGCWDKPRFQLANAQRFLGVVGPPKVPKRKFRRKSSSATMSVFSDSSRAIDDDKMSVMSEDLQVDMRADDGVLSEVPSLSVDVVEEAPYPTPPASFQDETDALMKHNGNGCGDVESSTSETSDKNESDGMCPVPIDRRNWKCKLCTDGAPGPCFICGKTEGETIRCKAAGCGKEFHEECLSIWPQKSITPSGQTSSLICPMHSCHVCTSDNPQSNMRGGVDTNRLVRCILCPSTYHYGDYCVTAGSKVLSATQIICPLHYKRHSRSLSHQSCIWCALCCKGGSLICCEYCPLVFHVDCLMMTTPPPEKYICEDCESGRFPLYGEIVWVKLGVFRWWPAKILYPNQIPLSLKNTVHADVGEFPVRFYGTHDHAWINRGRAFVYVDGDMISKLNEEGTSKEKCMRFSAQFELAHVEAAEEKNKQNHEKALRVSRTMPSMKPPKYSKISSNKLHSSAGKNSEYSKQNANVCECDPNSELPCGPDSVCINRLLSVECDPEACPAGTRCQNRCFELKQYPPMKVFMTESRGWGLKTLSALKKGDFVIEYVGEMIGTKEYQNRLELMRKNKDEKYYFLEIDKDRMLDAGPKGNLSRFMNHSCDPNCETQKWTVKGDTRIGLFASRDIPAGSELVFNYNLSTLGNARLECRCGEDKCSGYIGGKAVKLAKPPNGIKNGKLKSKRSKKRRRKSALANTLSPPPVKKTMSKRRSSAALLVSDTICGTRGDSSGRDDDHHGDDCSSCYTPLISDKSTIRCDECASAYHLCCVDLHEKPPAPWKCASHQVEKPRTDENCDDEDDKDNKSDSSS